MQIFALGNTFRFTGYPLIASKMFGIYIHIGKKRIIHYAVLIIAIIAIIERERERERKFDSLPRWLDTN